MAENENRCWPGYEPVPGKKPHSQGSCKPKAESKSSPSEKEFRAKRKKQLDQRQAEHPGTRRQSLQHLGPPSTAEEKAKKRPSASAKDKTGAPKKTAAKSSDKVKTEGAGGKKSAVRTSARKSQSKKTSATSKSKKGVKRPKSTRKAA